MKCTILSDNFKKALSLVERSTGKNLTLPILSSFLIDAEIGALKIIGTNLEIGIETIIRGTIQEQGKIAIPARALSSYISTIPKDEKITLESKDTDLIVKTQTQKTVFKGYQQDDFPPFPQIKDIYKLSIKKTDIIHTISRNLISISKNTIKPELASMYFSIEKDMLTIASTDSFRLSEEKIKPISFSPKIANESFLIPARTCEELIKLLEYSNDEEVFFTIGNGELLVKYNDTSLYSRLTEGNFPDYKQIIPKKFTTQAIVSRSTLANHIKRASIFANKLQGVTLAFTKETGDCVIESSNRDVGEYKASMKSDIHGNSINIVFNYHYLLDGIEGYADDTLSFGFNSESQPLLIRPVKKENSLYVVMPMKGSV
jgi:DNA polymerase-3 subunit beta